MTWKYAKLGEVCDVTSSKRVMSKNRTDEGVPFYCSKEIILLAKREPIEECEYVPTDLYEDIISKFGSISENDILLTTRGTLGVPYSIKSSDKFYFGDGNLTWLRSFSDEVNPNFVYYFLLSKYKNNFYTSAATTIPFLTINYVKQITIHFPERREQDIMAKILSQYDETIEVNSQRISILEKMAMRIYREWFVHYRFPGYKVTDFKEGLPKGWEKSSASNFFDITIGKTPSRKETQWFTESGRGVPWLSITDMKRGMFLDKSSEDLTEDAVKKHHVVVVQPDTVLLSFKLTVGRVGITTIPMCTNEAIAHFKTDNQNLREYTFCYLNNFQFSTLGSTSSIATAINSKTVKKMPFVMPNEEILREFNKIVSPIFDAIRNTQQQISQLQTMRDKLLPQLMSGHIDVSQ